MVACHTWGRTSLVTHTALIIQHCSKASIDQKHGKSAAHCKKTAGTRQFLDDNILCISNSPIFVTQTIFCPELQGLAGLLLLLKDFTVIRACFQVIITTQIGQPCRVPFSLFPSSFPVFITNDDLLFHNKALGFMFPFFEIIKPGGLQLGKIDFAALLVFSTTPLC